MMNRWLFVLLLCPCALWAQAAERYLSADDWASPRHGESLVRWPALAHSMRALASAPDSRLVIRYPGGEVGSLWAEDTFQVTVTDSGPVEVILDNADAGVSIVGSWGSSSYSPGYYGTDYLHDGNSGKGSH